MDLRLIVNPSAGRGRAAARLPAVKDALGALGFSFRVDETTSIEHARQLAREARDAGEVAVAMGGDGLAGAVAGELCGTDGVLAVLPGGRGNDFCRKLGIPQDPADACEVLRSGTVRAIDVAMVGGRSYLGIASAGFDSDVQDITNSTRLKLGSLVYLYGTMRAIRAWRPAEWDVVVDGDSHSFRGYSVAVGNSGIFGGGMRLMPDASLDDGELDVVFFGAASKRHFLMCLPKVFKGAHVDDPNLTFLRGREITFSADRPFTAYADGDPIADLPATVRVAPCALKVIAP
jgi:YegS/Rv2252/BmrU family lipid kinase